MGKYKEFMVLSDENVTDALLDLLQQSKMLNGEVFEDAELNDSNSFIIRLASGQSFTITIEED